MQDLRPGDPRRIGSYRLLGRLGEGGMGQVFCGMTLGGRRVAVKVIRPEYARDPEFRRRFTTEVSAARRVGGFHTAQVIDADTAATSPWLVTAFIGGPSLQEVVSRSGPLPPAEVHALAIGLAEGLAAIHQCGLVHRDLKPSNVIMAEDGPRIIDFGIAQMTDATSVTATGVVVGTFSFMSPEQIRADRAEPASDVFSLGCVLAFAATGSSPYAAATIPAISHRVLNEQPRLDGVTGGLRELIRACLAKAPADRPTPALILSWAEGEATRTDTEFTPTEAADPRTLRLAAADTAAAAPADLPTTTQPPKPVVAGQRHAPPEAGTGPPAVPAAHPEGVPRRISRRAVVIGSAGTLAVLGTAVVPAAVFRHRKRKLTDAVLTASDPVLALAFSPDSKVLATGIEHGAPLWSVETGKTVGSQGLPCRRSTPWLSARTVASSPAAVIPATA